MALRLPFLIFRPNRSCRCQCRFISAFHGLRYFGQDRQQCHLMNRGHHGVERKISVIPRIFLDSLRSFVEPTIRSWNRISVMARQLFQLPLFEWLELQKIEETTYMLFLGRAMAAPEYCGRFAEPFWCIAFMINESRAVSRTPCATLILSCTLCKVCAICCARSG